MKQYAYDIECYPNLFSAVFVNIDNEDDVHEFVLYKNRNDLNELINFVTSDCWNLYFEGVFNPKINLRLIGYNNLEYDDLLLKAIINNPDINNNKLYRLSKQIIETNQFDYSKSLKSLRYQEPPFESVDLMQLVSINTIRPSLKACAIHLKYGLIQDLPLDPNRSVKTQDYELLLKYNLNDVKATRLLYITLLPDIRLRELLGEKYNVSLLSASDSKIAKVVLDSAYGVPEVKQTVRHTLRVIDLLPSKLKFDTKELQSFLTKLSQKTIWAGKEKNHNYTQINEKVFIGNITCTLAQGGIHSEDDPGLFKSDDEYIYIDSDVDSFYPNIILNEKIVPEHVDNRFLDWYKDIVDRRLKAKDEGDKTTADTLKISVNSTFGLMGFPYYWLYDMKCMYQVTISGQLYLLDLAEKLVESGFELISMNTDGVLFKVKRNREQEYYAICDKWYKRTNFKLSHEQYKLYARRDVNNYMAVTYKDKIKTKGIFVDNLKLNKRSFIRSFNAPIIALALQAYFKDSAKPSTTIYENDDIHNFFFSQRVGKQFELIAESIKNGIIHREKLQKTNRWIVVKKGDKLVKVKNKTKGRSALMKNCYVTIGNNVNDVSLDMIDYDYYIDEVNKIITEIEGKPQFQRSLF